MPLHLLVKWEGVSPNSRWRILTWELNGRWFPQNFSHFMFFSCFMLCSNIKKKHFAGGWGLIFFSHFMFSLHSMLFPTFLEKTILKSALSLIG